MKTQELPGPPSSSLRFASAQNHASEGALPSPATTGYQSTADTDRNVTVVSQASDDFLCNELLITHTFHDVSDTREHESAKIL